jgi:hypothetical protein
MYSSYITNLINPSKISKSSIDNVIGRKVDLSFRGYLSTELSTMEGKPKYDKSTSQKKQGKCIRLNQMLQKKLEYLGVDVIVFVVFV